MKREIIVDKTTNDVIKEHFTHFFMVPVHTDVKDAILVRDGKSRTKAYSLFKHQPLGTETDTQLVVDEDADWRFADEQELAYIAKELLCGRYLRYGQRYENGLKTAMSDLLDLKDDYSYNITFTKGVQHD